MTVELSQQNLYVEDTLQQTAVDIILRSQLTLLPRTDLSIAGGHVQYKAFLPRNLYTFYFRQFFTVSFKFSSIFVILLFSQFNGLFRSMKMQGLQIFRDYQSAFISVVDVFSSCKDVQSVKGQRQKYEYNYGDFCCTGQPLFLYSENQYEPKKQHYCSLCQLALSRVTKHSPISCFQIII